LNILLNSELPTKEEGERKGEKGRGLRGSADSIAENSQARVEEKKSRKKADNK